jgi:hypothetical protein
MIGGERRRSASWGAKRMTDRLRYEHVQKARDRFAKAGLDASAFAGCSDEEIGLLLAFQQEILVKSYNDYASMIASCSTNYIYAMDYKKRKQQFAKYAADNAGVASDGALNAATVMIYKNAMRVELSELCTFFYVFLATDADRAWRSTPGRFTPRPEDVFERYYKGYSGCFSVIVITLVAIGYLVTLA